MKTFAVLALLATASAVKLTWDESDYEGNGLVQNKNGVLQFPDGLPVGGATLTHIKQRNSGSRSAGASVYGMIE